MKTVKHSVFAILIRRCKNTFIKKGQLYKAVIVSIILGIMYCVFTKELKVLFTEGSSLLSLSNPHPVSHKIRFFVS